MPASSHTSPTSGMRRSSSPHDSQVIGDVVDPGPLQLLQLLEPAHRPLLELGLRADHVQVPAAAGVERERQPVVALACEMFQSPMLTQPVVHPLADVLRNPLDLRIRVRSSLPHLVGGDEPSSTIRKISGVWQRQHSG